jgi:hypothetical protein
MGLILSGPGRDKIANIIFRGSRAVVKNLPYKSKIMGLIIATASGMGQEERKWHSGRTLALSPQGYGFDSSYCLLDRKR